MICVKDLQFRYRGKTESTLKGLNFEVKDGELFGFLGPSGAGKSTTQKIIIGLLKQYSGSVQVMGQELSQIKRNFYENIGVSFELPNLFQKMTGRENLEYFRSLYRGECEDINLLLQKVDLQQSADVRVSAYSKGMQMRLNFIRAFLNKPKVLFLDEPTSGLDPNNAQRIKDIIKEAQAKGTTIFITTHNMTVADEICDRVAFIVDGEIRLIDSPRELKIQKTEKIVRVSTGKGSAKKDFDYPLQGLEENIGFLNLLKTNTVETMHTLEPSLDDIFKDVTGRTLV